MPDSPHDAPRLASMSIERFSLRYLDPRRAGDVTRWAPPTDIVETPGEIVIRVELAGVDRESLEVHQDGDCVVIAGRRPEPRLPEAVVKYHQVEVDYGDFVRVVRLIGLPPHVEIRAQYTDGFLLVHIPRAALTREPTRREIPID